MIVSGAIAIAHAFIIFKRQNKNDAEVTK